MRQVFGCLLLITALSGAGCTAPAGHTLSGRAVAVRERLPTAVSATSPPARHPALTSAVSRYLAARTGRAAIMVLDVRTGATFGFQADRGFVVASVAKVNILIARLMTRKQLTPQERALTDRMIRLSDNQAADTLYRVIGNGGGMAAANARLGLTCTFLYPQAWGAARTCPADQIKLLSALVLAQSPVPDLSRTYALQLMSAVTPSQRWGITAAARPGERVALKNGWTPLRFQGSGWAVNSIGRIKCRGHDFLIA
ncbi:MAG: serine hydrolase, partial [Streptosporangiaceae bacterium]